MLVSTHLLNTAGIALATYGGSPSAAKPGEKLSQALHITGNILMLLVMIGLCWWLWLTWKRPSTALGADEYHSATVMIVAACIAVPFHLVCLVSATVFSFTQSPALDPITGIFLARLFLIFGPQLGVVLALLRGGWFSRRPSKSALRADSNGSFAELGSMSAL